MSRVSLRNPKALLALVLLLAMVLAACGDAGELGDDDAPSDDASDDTSDDDAGDDDTSDDDAGDDDAEPDGMDAEAEEAGLADDPVFTWAITGADRDIHVGVAELWNEQNPDSQVEILFLAPTADEQRQAMFQDLQTQQGAFDVLGLDVIWTGEFADLGYIENLEDLRSEVDGVSLPGAVDSSSWQGDLWALPYSSNAGFLYYRSDLVDTPPTTWDELFDVAAEVSEAEGIQGYVAQGDAYEGFVVNFLELFWSAGGELFNDDDSEVLFLDGDAATTTLDWMTRAFAEGVYAEGYDSMVEDDARAIFQAGDAVFMRNWPYAVPLLEGEDGEDTAVSGSFGIAPLPTFDGSGTISALGGLNNAISVLSDNQDIAREFIVWAATDPDAQAILAENSLPPTRLATFDDFDDDEVFALLGEVLPDARARPPVPGYNSLSLAMQDNLHPAFRGQGDADSALSTVESAAESALEG